MVSLQMNGILNILKPPGMTSFDVVAYLRSITKIRKIGHAGTLDPEAAGVLAVCLGSATKAIEYMADMDKAYRAELTLGVETDTQDAWGKVTRTCDAIFPEHCIREAMMVFIGKYNQVPPMYSALKVKGKKLYELARDGKTVERRAREVKIYSLDVVNIRDNNKVLFDVVCSKGTYIRTLCADIGERLGCGGHMSFLLRRRVGFFDISLSLALDTVKILLNENKLSTRLIKTEEVFKGFSEVTLSVKDEEKFKNGVFIELFDIGLKPGALVRVYSPDRDFIALGEVIGKNRRKLLKSKKRFDG
jgi:tRNA pseudouridine55 synthase